MAIGIPPRRYSAPRPDGKISLLFVHTIVPTWLVDDGLYLSAVFVIVATPFLVAQFN